MKIGGEGSYHDIALTSRPFCAPWKSTSSGQFVPEFDPHAHSYIQMIDDGTSVMLRIEWLTCQRDIK